MNSSKTPREIVECAKCGGTGIFLHFGTCFQCKGEGKHPVRVDNRKPVWAKSCICLDPQFDGSRSHDGSSVLCFHHTFNECVEAREQLKLELRADTEWQAEQLKRELKADDAWRAFQAEHGERIWASAYEERFNGI